MKNRAKCKLCSSIIESYHSTDLVLCKCGEISVDGGDAMRCAAKDWSNFLRVDDNGNEIIVTVKSDDVKPLYIEGQKPTKKELLSMLDDMITSIERMPEGAMVSPVNHYDYCALMMLLAQILKTSE